MILYRPPASIQGAILTLKTKRFNPFPPRKDESYDCIIYKFTLQGSSHAAIKKELNPKERFCEEKESLLDSEDGIAGHVIRGFSSGPIKIKGGIPGSSSHRTQGADTPEGNNFAELEVSFSTIPRLSN